MKAILEFSLPEEREEYEMTMQASNMHCALWDVSNQIFRPARKHGYNDLTLDFLLEKLNDMVKTYGKEDKDWPCNEFGPLDATDLVALLENRFSVILDENNIKL